MGSGKRGLKFLLITWLFFPQLMGNYFVRAEPAAVESSSAVSASSETATAETVLPETSLTNPSSETKTETRQTEKRSEESTTQPTKEKSSQTEPKPTAESETSSAPKQDDSLANRLVSQELNYLPADLSLPSLVTDTENYTWRKAEVQDPWKGGILQLKVKDVVRGRDIARFENIVRPVLKMTYKVYLPPNNPNLTAESMRQAIIMGESSVIFAGRTVPLREDQIKIENNKTLVVDFDSKVSGFLEYISAFIDNFLNILADLLNTASSTEVGFTLTFDANQLGANGAVEDKSVGKVVSKGKLPPSADGSINLRHEFFGVRGTAVREASEAVTPTWNRYISPWNQDKANSDHFGKGDDTQTDGSQEVTGVGRVLKGENYASRLLQFPLGETYPHDNSTKRPEYYRIVNLFTKQTVGTANLAEATQHQPTYVSSNANARGEIHRKVKTMFYGAADNRQSLSPVPLRAQTSDYLEMVNVLPFPGIDVTNVAAGTDQLKFNVNLKASNSDNVVLRYELTGPGGQLINQNLGAVDGKITEAGGAVTFPMAVNPAHIHEAGKYTLKIFAKDAAGIEVNRTVSFTVAINRPTELSWSKDDRTKELTLNIDKSETAGQGLTRHFYWRDEDVGDKLQFQIKKGDKLLTAIDRTVTAENQVFTDLSATIPENEIAYGANVFTVEVYLVGADGKISDKQDALTLTVNVSGKLVFERSPEVLKWTKRNVRDSRGILKRDEGNGVELTVLDSRDMAAEQKNWQLTAQAVSEGDREVPFELVWKKGADTNPVSLAAAQVVMTGKDTEPQHYRYSGKWDNASGVLLNSDNYLPIGDYSGQVTVIWLLKDTPTAD